MLDDYAELRTMSDAAWLVARKTDWPPLYDVKALRSNRVPVYAAVYTEDMYVEQDFAVDTARTIKGCKYLLTNRIYRESRHVRSQLRHGIRH